MNKLWRIGNHLSKMGWVPRKISRILELINHLTEANGLKQVAWVKHLALEIM